MLHLNNAGSALMPKPVIKEINEYITLETRLGGYEAATLTHDKSQNFYHYASKLINANPHEISYMENATRAWEVVFHSLNLGDGDRIITSTHEYGSNYLAFLLLKKRKNIHIEILPNDAYGQVCLFTLKNIICNKTKLISIPHIPSNNGLINPAEEVGIIAESKNIFYLLDTTQSLGQIPIDVKKIKCNALCATGRKYLRGPRGSGFLYVDSSSLELLEPPFINLYTADWISPNDFRFHNNNKRFETFEFSHANRLGFAAAIKYTLQLGIDPINQRIQVLSNTLRDKLCNLKGVTLQDTGIKKSGLVTFSIEKIPLLEVYNKLKEKNINISICWNSYARIDSKERKVGDLIRASVHYYNTEEEIDQFIHEMGNIIRNRKQI